MSKKVLLISEQQIKDQTVIEQNVDAGTLSRTIWNTQELELRPILGTDLYNAVLASVHAFSTSGTTMTAQMKTLLNDYIQPYLLHAVVSQYLVVNNYKVTNKGVLKLRDDVGNSVSDTELETFKNYFDNYTAQYKAQLVKFLHEQNLLAGTADTDTTSSSTGWYL